jgi:hypothetical protein
VSYSDPGVFACKAVFKSAKTVEHKGKKYLTYYWYPGADDSYCPDLSLIAMPTICMDPTGRVRVPMEPQEQPKTRRGRKVEAEPKKEKKTRLPRADVNEAKKKEKKKPAAALRDKCASYIYREAAKLNNEKLMQVAKFFEKRANGDEAAAINLRAILGSNTGPLAELQRNRDVRGCKFALDALKKFVSDFTDKHGDAVPVPFSAYQRKCMVLAGDNISNFCFLLLQCATSFQLRPDFSVAERKSAADFIFETGDSSAEDSEQSDEESSIDEQEVDGDSGDENFSSAESGEEDE